MGDLPPSSLWQGEGGGCTWRKGAYVQQQRQHNSEKQHSKPNTNNHSYSNGSLQSFSITRWHVFQQYVSCALHHIPTQGGAGENSSSTIRPRVCESVRE